MGPFRQAAAWHALTCLTALSLVSCGGGGGSGGGTPGNATPSAGTASTTPLAIDDRNGIVAALAGASYAELIVGLAELTSQWVDAVETSGTLTRSRACSSGGTEALTVEDVDGNGHISRGDVLHVELDRCYSRWVDQPLSGSASFTWTSRTDRANFAGLMHFGSGFALVDASATLGITGNLQVRHAVSGAITEVEGSSDPTEPIGVTWSGVAAATGGRIASRVSKMSITRQAAAPSSFRDTLQRLDVLKAMDIAQARITTSVQLQVSSELLGGQIEVRTPTVWTAGVATYPESGNLWITGANRSRLTWKASGQAAFDGQARLELDTQGDGVADYTASLPWSEVSDGAFGALEDRASDEAATSAFTPFLPRNGDFAMATSPGTRALHNVLPPLRWQFSDPVTLPSTGALRLHRETTNGRRNPWVTNSAYVPLTVSQQGAFVELTASEPLEPGTTYRLVDAFDSVPMIGTPKGSWRWDYTVTADDNIQASVTVPQPGIISTGVNATLTATHAYSGTSPLAFSWRQLSGPPAVLSSTSAADITISAPASGGSNGDAEFELRMQTLDGDLDIVRVKLPLIGDPLHTIQALFSPVSPGAWTVGAGWSPGNTFVADYRNGGNSARVFLNAGFSGETVMQLAFSAVYDTQPQIGGGVLFLFIPSGPFAATSYSVGRPGANAVTINDGTVLSSCFPGTGTFVIQEIELGPTNEIIRLALDFDRDSCPGAPAHSGSIRVNSSIPLRTP